MLKKKIVLVGNGGAIFDNEIAMKGRRIWIATIVFVVVVVVVVVLTEFIVFFEGNSHFDNGVVTITDCIETLEKIFTNLYGACVTISLG